LGILSVLLITSLGIASALPWEGQRGTCEGCEDCEGRPAPEEMQAIREAIASGDWGTYTSLRGEYGLDKGIHAQMTEQTFLKLSEIQMKQEELRLLRQELAEEMGLEVGSEGFVGKGGMHLGMRGRSDGPGRGASMFGGTGEGA